jgi:CubicO group peptidase (beta-lactamase class C family)
VTPQTRIRIPFLVVALSLFPAASSWAAQEAANDETLASAANHIEALVRPQSEAELLSGVILVARGEKILFHKAWGFANWELRAPSSPELRFGIASITKPMTETLVHILAQAGRIDLDAPVERYLPAFPRGPEGGVPTVRHLATHRSGVPHRVTDSIDETQVLRPSDIVERVRARGLLFEPGTERLYSSAGYTCLARVIETVENKPFESVLEERVFRPAGMAGAVSETGQRLMPGRAMPYRLGAVGRRVAVKSAAYKDLRFLTGAGSVYATAEDLLRFVQAVRDGVFGADLSEEMFGGEPASWHSWTGRTNGNEASVDVLPAENLTFVFLSNLQSAANWQVREQIRDILLGRAATAIPFPPPVVEPFEDPESLVGSYGSADIRLVDGSLFRGENELYPTAGRRYYIPASGTVMRFRRDSQGVVDAIISLGGSGQETLLPKSNGR